MRTDKGCSGFLKQQHNATSAGTEYKAGLGLGSGDMPRDAEPQEGHSQQHVLGAHGFLQNSEVLAQPVGSLSCEVLEESEKSCQVSHLAEAKL